MNLYNRELGEILKTVKLLPDSEKDKIINEHSDVKDMLTAVVLLFKTQSQKREWILDDWECDLDSVLFKLTKRKF